ncbi:MAG: translation initiation factor IF-2 [Anaerolineae bacterium]|nr:translation initiation factor IF-2 [Thermoflexales bacterium]MDW8407995.1 translation initiation factor IF-2 [Anaerolineae bacterium]
MATVTKDTTSKPAGPTNGRDNRSGSGVGDSRRAAAGPRAPTERRPGGQDKRPAEPKMVELPDQVTVRDLATLINVSPINVIRELMNNGVMANINQQLDFDTAAIVVSSFGYEAKPKQIAIPTPVSEESLIDASAGPASPAKPTTLRQRLLAKEAADMRERRPPVVTVMGHVDHGKTSLLDAIRKTNVAAGEAGGITQHIGAYQVEHEGRKVTFIDTPGHEAFTAMRARGAQITDIAVLVVAADDGVMPQTKEAISHARAAQVPIIVALNKIDKPNANPERVKKELAENGLTPDDWGGDTMVVPVSAKQRKGIDDLIEAILLVAESMDTIRANPDRPAVGTIIESQLDKSRGPMATVLIQNGTLNLGDSVVVGSVPGKVRAMFDFRGHRVKKATPSMPVSILGLSDVPSAGDILEVMEDDRAARALAAQRSAAKAKEMGPARATTLDEFFAQAKAGKARKLLLIVKADNDGSLQPIVDSLMRLNTPDAEVSLEIIHRGIGGITEGDVELAVASGAVILGFEVEMDTAARRKAELNKVDIRTYDVIYKLIEDVELALKGLLAPKIVKRTVGSAEVKQTFKISKVGMVAGVVVRSGVAQRNAQGRVLRSGKEIYSGKIGSLKRLTEDVQEVRQGFECGVSIEGFADFKPGDVIEFFVEEEQRLV